MSDDTPRWGLKVRVWVECGGRKVLGPGRVELLERIARTHSISAAAREMKMSYRRAWELVQAMNEAGGGPLVETSTGGSGGGGATVTPRGHEAIRLYRSLVDRFATASAEVSLPADPLVGAAGTDKV